eukprot:2971473-Ditylum_brightwellii.AAC.1
MNEISLPTVTGYFAPSGGPPVKVQPKPGRTKKDSHYDWGFNITLICHEDDEPLTTKARTVPYCYLNIFKRNK